MSPRDGIILTPEPAPGADEAARVAVSDYSSTNIPTRPGEVREDVGQLAETTQRALDDVENDRQKVERAINASVDAINQHAGYMEQNRNSISSIESDVDDLETVTQDELVNELGYTELTADYNNAPAGTDVLPFNSVVNNTNNFFPSAADLIEVPENAYYRIAAAIGYTVNPGAQNYYARAAIRAGAVDIVEDFRVVETAATWPSVPSKGMLHISIGPVFFAAGMNIDIEIQHSRVAGLAWKAGSYMSIEKVRDV